jgi:hypothetical protein
LIVRVVGEYVDRLIDLYSDLVEKVENDGN